MKQMTLAPAGFERYAKSTRRSGFLAEMDRVVPWGERTKNTTKSRVRAKVKHAFLIIKRIIGFARVRLPGSDEECQSAVRELCLGQSV